MHGIDLTMDFNGKDAADFEISALIGLDVIAKLISPNGNSEIPMKKIDDIILIQIGNKHLPFGSRSSKESVPKRKSLIALGGPSVVKSAFLDILLKEFFETESPSPLQGTMEQEMNQSYERKFKETHTLVNNTEEAGAKRFSVIPHWKPAELRPDYSPVSSTKETLRRYLALERKINMTRNKKFETGL